MAGPLMVGPQKAGPLTAGPLTAGLQVAGPQMEDGWAWLADGCRLLAGAADRVNLLTAKALALSLFGLHCPSSPLG